MVRTEYKCSKCGIIKPIADFAKRKSAGPGHSYACKRCLVATNSVWYQANKEKVAKRARAWRVENTESRKRHMRHWRVRQYGIEPDDFEDMLKAQGRKCALCGVTEEIALAGRKRRFDIDHCHTTGTVRGLLCNSCNLAIGKANDDPALLRRMADYIDAGGWF